MFGIAENVKSKVRVCTPELFFQTIRSKQVADVCAQITDALENLRRGGMTKEEFETVKGNLKKLLPIFTPHATFTNGRRVNAEAVPSGISMYDKDHISDPRGWWDEKRKLLEQKGILPVVLFTHVTPSGEGCRLFFVIPKGMNLAEAQQWMAVQLEDTQYDSCVKDFARSSFAVPEEYVLYLDEEGLFRTPVMTFTAAEDSVDAKVNAPTSGTQILRDAQDDTLGGTGGTTTDSTNGTTTYPPTFQDIPYTQIVETLEEQMGGIPEHGSRNNFIFSMACHLRYVCNDDCTWISQILPTYGEARDKWMASIRSACARSQTKRMPRIMKRTLDICRGMMAATDALEEKRLPPPMPRKLPPLVKLLLEPIPEIYRPAVAHAIFPPLAVHLHRVLFRYIDNITHEATLMNVLMAGTGAGKDCISEPINRIMADIRRRDEENLQREKKWKSEVNTKGANKDKSERPQGLVIQEIDADMTNPAFVMRTAEADDHFLYTKLNEIDQFDALKGNGKGGQQFQIMCLSFDPRNRYGQTRSSAQSITEKVTVRFNWNASTTILKGKRYFRNVLTDGPISRINFCTIPEREIGAEMPVYGTYSESFDDELRPYIERLTHASGEVKCPEAFRLAKKLKDENAEFARLSQSRVFENLSFRANVIAYLKACILYVAHGYRWDKTMEDFIRWSLQYDLWCKMEFFGDAIAAAMHEGDGTHSTRGPQSLLSMLPDAFTLQEVERLRQRLGLSTGTATKNMLSQWKHRGYILQMTEMTNDSFVKSEKYKNK